MPHYLVGGWIILLFYHIRVPFYGDVTNFEEIRNEFVDTRLNDATATFVDPVANGAGVALPVDHFEYKGLQSFRFAIQSNELFPVGIVPPE